MENTNENQKKGTYQYIRCPICGSRSIEFVTEYHKAIFAKIAQFVFFALTLAFAFIYISEIIRGNINSDSKIVLIVFGIILTAITIYIIVTESKTHVCGICRDCGHIWLLN